MSFLTTTIRCLIFSQFRGVATRRGSLSVFLSTSPAHINIPDLITLSTLRERKNYEVLIVKLYPLSIALGSDIPLGSRNIFGRNLKHLELTLP
jgi:hypothetical protein